MAMALFRTSKWATARAVVFLRQLLQLTIASTNSPTQKFFEVESCRPTYAERIYPLIRVYLGPEASQARGGVGIAIADRAAGEIL